MCTLRPAYSLRAISSPCALSVAAAVAGSIAAAGCGVAGTYEDIWLGEGAGCALHTGGAVGCWRWDSSRDPEVLVSDPAKVIISLDTTCALSASSAAVSCAGRLVENGNVPASTEGVRDFELAGNRPGSIDLDGIFHYWPDDSAYAPPSEDLSWTADPMASFTQVDAFWDALVLLRDDGVLECNQWPDCAWGDTPVIRVSTGPTATCGLTDGGSVLCDDGTSRRTNAIVEAAPTGAGFRDLAVGRWAACALDGEGIPVCWPEKVMEDLVIPQVSLTTIHTAIDGLGWCGVTADHAAVCWGSERFLESLPSAMR